MSSAGLERARAKMSEAGIDPVAIETFAHYYRLLEHGETGMIAEDSIEPLDSESLDDVEVDDETGPVVAGTAQEFADTRGHSALLQRPTDGKAPSRLKFRRRATPGVSG